MSSKENELSSKVTNAGSEIEVGVKKYVTSSDHDVAAEFLSCVDQAIIQNPISMKEYRNVLWKIDLYILPLIAGSVILSAVDKVIISNAAIYGMREDTHLIDNQFSWVGSIFYFGYLLFEGPSALLIQRLPVAKFLGGTILGWGVLMMCTAATQNFAGLATVRFVMGMLEAPVFPICSVLTVMWWTNTEQPIRVAFWYNQFSSIFSGIISYGIGQTRTSLSPWRLLYIVLGAFSLFWGGVIILYLPDSPVKARYLSDREKYICIDRVKNNNTGIEDKRIKWCQIQECLVDPKTWLLFIFACAQNIPNGGLITFASIIVSGLGYSPLLTTILGIPTGVLATAWQLLLSIPCSKINNSRCLIIALANIAPIISAILMWKLPRSNKKGLLAAYYVFYSYWGPYVLSTSLPMGNISGHSKKVTMNAIFFMAYCIGNIIGPQLFRASDAPDYSPGYLGLLVSLIVAMVAISGYGFVCYSENKRRDRLSEITGVRDGVDGAFSDLTDVQKKDFRYIY